MEEIKELDSVLNYIISGEKMVEKTIRKSEDGDITDIFYKPKELQSDLLPAILKKLQKDKFIKKHFDENSSCGGEAIWVYRATFEGIVFAKRKAYEGSLNTEERAARKEVRDTLYIQITSVLVAMGTIVLVAVELVKHYVWHSH